MRNKGFVSVSTLCQPFFVRKTRFDSCCAFVYLFSSSGKTLSPGFSPAACCQNEAGADGEGEMELMKAQTD